MTHTVSPRLWRARAALPRPTHHLGDAIEVAVIDGEGGLEGKDRRAMLQMLQSWLKEVVIELIPSSFGPAR